MFGSFHQPIRRLLYSKHITVKVNAFDMNCCLESVFLHTLKANQYSLRRDAKSPFSCSTFSYSDLITKESERKRINLRR